MPGIEFVKHDGHVATTRQIVRVRVPGTNEMRVAESTYEDLGTSTTTALNASRSVVCKNVSNHSEGGSSIARELQNMYPELGLCMTGMHKLDSRHSLYMSQP